MIRKIPLRGVSGALYAWRDAWHGDIQTVCLREPRRCPDLSVLLAGPLRVIEIDGTFHVGRVFVIAYVARATGRSDEVSFSPDPDLYVAASFDSLDAALTCFYLECGS